MTDMLYDIGALEQIPRGEGRNFLVAGTTVAVFRNHADEVFATQPQCPHKQGPLADGLLGGRTLICPLHERAFDLATGLEMGSDCGLRVYPASLSAEGSVQIDLG
ncbi:nitrite reductase small subunit NirD [soil metagenome]